MATLRSKSHETNSSASTGIAWRVPKAYGKGRNPYGKGFAGIHASQRGFFCRVSFLGHTGRVSKNTWQITFQKNEKTDFKNNKKIILIQGRPHCLAPPAPTKSQVTAFFARYASAGF